MIKTIIVDDEILVRVGLKSMVNWEDMGFEIVGEAGDGIQALELCENQEVDLVITDIKMPKMDGISLIRTLCETHPSVRVIVLSCYNDGEYIKEAMKYNGALDYIFKIAMDGAELKNTLERVKKIIIADRDRSGNDTAQQQKFVQDSGKTEAWNRILNVEEEYKIGELERYFAIRFDEPYRCINIRLLIQEDFRHRPQEEMWKENKPYFVSTVTSLLGRDKVKFDLSFLRQETVLLISMARPIKQELLVELCKKLDRMNSFWTNAHMIFGISGIVTGIGQLSKAHGCAVKALEKSFFTGNAEISFYQESVKTAGTEKNLPSRYEMKILLYNENYEEIRTRIGDYFEHCRKSGQIGVEELKENCIVFLSSFAAILSSRLEHDFLARCKKNLWEKIMNCSTLSNLQLCVMDYVERLFSELEKQESKFLSAETKKALQYIHDNYMRELRLKDMADYIGMNESYLSHIFKKEYGKGLITYLNEYRILKAQELIVSSDVSLNLIAESVGYTNYTYFSKVFKSVTGVNAVDFKASTKKV